MSKGAVSSPRKEWMIPVAVAIIGLAGTLVPPLIGQLLAGSSGKPEIIIHGYISDPGFIDSEEPFAEEPSEEGNNNSATKQVSIFVTNIGSSPATNMTLIVESLHPILEAFTNSSTVEISSTNIEDSYLFDSRFTASIPKLNQGGGAYVGVYLNVSTPDPLNAVQTVVEREGSVFSEAYSVYAVYNEGSSSKFFPLTPFEEFQEFYGVFGSISLIIVYVLVVVLFLIFFIHRARRGRVKTFISKLLENITEIRRALRNNNNSITVFPNDWKIDEGHRKNEEHRKYIQQKATLDYILLDDFYTKLDERNQSLPGDIIPQKLENLNQNLLQPADNALQKIDWEKYTS